MEENTSNPGQINPVPNATTNNLANTPRQSGIVKLVGIVMAILVFLAILNYFNILSLSGLFPNQLGWLPRQTKPNIYTPQTPDPSQQSNPIPPGSFRSPPNKPVTPDLP